MTRGMYLNMRTIGKIRRNMDSSTCARVVNALVTSRLDLNNCLLYGVPGRLIHRLQVVQNQSARLVSRSKYRDHITPVLYNLHWLPVAQRIKYKVLTLIYKCLHMNVPSYLCDELKLYQVTRNLRSSEDSTRLNVPRCAKSYGDSSFRVFGPKLWNSVPSSIRNSVSLAAFKKHLKTYLFKEYFN